MTVSTPDESNKPPRKLLLKRALLLAVTLLGCVVAAEIGMRIHARIVGDHTTIISDNRLGWKLLPGARRTMQGVAGPYRVEINSHGMRDDAYAVEKPPGVRRIAVVGDSFVFGAGGVEHRELFTELLESQLTAVEVLNFGVPGYSPDQEYLALETSVLPFQPDLVILCLFWNDDNETSLSFHPKIGRPKPSFRVDGDRLTFVPPEISTFAVIAEHSELLSWIRGQVTTFYAKQWSIPTRDITNQERATCFDLLFRLLLERCRESDAELMVVYFPFPWKGQVKSTLMQQVVEQFATANGVPYVDTTSLFRDPNEARPTHFAVDGHFTPFGHKLVAGALIDHLRDYPALRNGSHSPGLVE